MSQPRITEIKNKLMKVQEEGLKDTQKLLDQALAFNEWAMNVQKRIYENGAICIPRKMESNLSREEVKKDRSKN